MDRKSFELLYQDAVEALTSRRMHDALNCIRGILFNTENPELNRELESVQQDYGMHGPSTGPCPPQPDPPSVHVARQVRTALPRPLRKRPVRGNVQSL